MQAVYIVTPQHVPPAQSGDVSAVASELQHTLRDHSQLSLMHEAIKDAQGTIRAVDTKVGILLAALAIPLPYIVTAVSAAHAHGLRTNLGTICGSVALVAYAIAGFVAIRSLTGMGNAGSHVTRSQRPPDVFYLGGLYRLAWLDSIFNRRSTLSRRELDEIVAAVPRDTPTALRVLVNELMVLAYIRDIKLYRQKVAFELTALAFVLGLVTLAL